MTTAPGSPPEVLVVGWYPSADAISAGRFIADQAAALAASGRARPTVVAFDNAAVRGPGWLRDLQASAVANDVQRGLAAFGPFVRHGANGPASVPLARLSIANGRTPATGPEHRGVHEVAAVEALLDSVEGRRWDLVHGHVGYPEGWAASVAARRLGVRLVITEHASYLGALLSEPILRDRYRETLLGAARVIAVSATLAAEVELIVPELAGRIVVIPNAVAVEDFAPSSAPRVGGELLFVGGRVASKGIETLLRAFAVAHRERPATTLRLVGPPAPLTGDAPWRELAAQLGIADVVRFDGPADRGGVAAAMARADLFVHPSPRETFGVVAVEALAAGLPVVATASGGVDEILAPDPSAVGAIAPPNEPEALGAAIVATLDRRTTFDPSRLRAHVADRFGADRVAGRLSDLYGEVVISRARGGATSPERPPARLPGRTIVVGFPRLELDRAVERFPRNMFDGVAIVTTEGDGALPAATRVRVAPGAATVRSVAELLNWGPLARGIRARVARRFRRAIGRAAPSAADPSVGLAERVLADLRSALAAELPDPDGSAGPGGEPPLLVCLTGIDHLVAAPFVSSGRATIAPGGLRWLADVRAAGVRADEGDEPVDGNLELLVNRGDSRSAAR